MDYFNFEEASGTVPPLDLDMANTENEYGLVDSVSDIPTASTTGNTAYPNPSVNTKKYGTTIKLRLINDREVEGILWDHNDSTNFPMFRAKEACDLCARMGLDCFLASRGALITGCTCCISLFRECSFTHPLPPRGYVPTMSGIAEDTQQCQGRTIRSQPPMKSYEEAKARKTGARFPRDAVKVLKRWLTEHSDHPYPNEREKDELKDLTGLKRSQIANWLANARRRGKVRPPSDPSSPMIGAIDIPGSVNIADLNPMDRWKASPPENEPARMTDIARAVSAAPVPSTSSLPSRQNSRASSRKASSEEDSNWSVFRAPTVSSFGTKESSNSDLSFASSHSLRSQTSKVSRASSNERRRRRRAPMTQRAVAQATKARGARIFQCTFCTDAFPSKYDWQRHEKSLHLALERWICCPTGGTIDVAGSDQKRCAFCPKVDPTEAHLETHNFTACHEKNVQERTYYRKDHLRQHLKLMHETKFNPAMEVWKSTSNEIQSRCGFCAEKFNTWQARVDHLSIHFRNGADMVNWSGDLGLEPHIEVCVENAIPPYLIGLERSTMNPFVAKAGAGRRSPSQAQSQAQSHSSASLVQPGLSHGSSPIGDMDGIPSVADENYIAAHGWFAIQRREITKYILDQQSRGITPTDKQIQDHSRELMYGTTDPIDWTCADHDAWLQPFKAQIGFSNSPCPVSSEIHGSGQSSQGPQTPATHDFGFPLLAGEEFDSNMQLDFDAADLSSLNLDDLANLGVNDGIPEFGALNTSMDDMDMPYTAAQKQPSAQAVFDTFDMPFDLAHDTSLVDDSVGAMSAQDLDQLTQYMAGFNAKKF